MSRLLEMNEKARKTEELLERMEKERSVAGVVIQIITLGKWLNMYCY